jgi:predicted XRE-type DNA-binding protein
MKKRSGNVFIDLGYPEEQAINIVARLELMVQIEDIVKKHDWTQKQAAKILRLTQSRVSELMSGRSEKFTVDMLMKLLDHLGKKVVFRVIPKGKAA